MKPFNILRDNIKCVDIESSYLEDKCNVVNANI